MSVDVIIVNSPNKNIDYPGLSLPVLSAALREKGYRVLQIDYNVILRDQILSQHGLNNLLECIVPFLCSEYCESEFHLLRLGQLNDYIKRLNISYRFSYLENVKFKVQNQEFEWVFSKEKRFRAYLELFKINRALHYIIDACILSHTELPSGFIADSIEGIFSDLISKIATDSPCLLGFSILDIQRGFSLALINKIRPSYDGKIVVGGPDATRFPEEYMKLCKGIDIVFVGESEESLPCLVNELKSANPKINAIPGIYYRKKSGAVRNNKSRPIDFNYNQSPDFHGLPLKKYLTPALPLQISRGCYWEKCNFCIHYDTYGTYHKRNIELVINDIKNLVSEYKTKYFHFTDDCISLALADKLTESIIHNKLDIRWLSYFRFEKGLNKNRLDRIYSAGGRVLELGLESASEKVLELMNKKVSISATKRIIEDASKRGFLLKLFMFHGYPGENINELKETIEFTQKRILEKKIRAFFPLRNRFELLRGSDIYESCRAGKNKYVKKMWESSGLFGIRGQYVSDINDTETIKLINEFVINIKKYMETEKIYNTDDENVMLDLIVMEHKNPKKGWHCI